MMNMEHDRSDYQADINILKILSKIERSGQSQSNRVIITHTVSPIKEI